MFSDRPGDKRMRKLLAGTAIAGGTVLGIQHCNNQGAAPPPVPVSAATPSSLAMATGEHKARMKQAMQGMDQEQIKAYLLDEITKAASMRARGILEGESADLYYDFVPRASAIADILNQQEKDVRTYISSKANIRRQIFEGELSASPAYQEKVLEVFSASYDNAAQAQEAIARHRQSEPNFMEIVANEILSAYMVLCEKIGQNREQARGG